MTAGRLDLISINEKSACLNRAGCINHLSSSSKKKSYDKKSDRVSETFNQIPSADEILPDLNHSGIYNNKAVNTLKRKNLYLNHVVPEHQVTNKVNKERDKPNP